MRSCKNPPSLCIDAKESSNTRNLGIKRLMNSCGLMDLHSHLNQESDLLIHQQGTVKTDFVSVSPDIIPCVTQAVILLFDSIFFSDHRPMLFDLDIEAFFSGIVKASMMIASFVGNQLLPCQRLEYQLLWCKQIGARIGGAYFIGHSNSRNYNASDTNGCGPNTYDAKLLLSI